MVVSGNAITGTLYNQTDETKALVHDWGAGYFLALRFSDFSEGLTYDNVQVGLDPSEGSGLVTLDIDCNGVFKITNKATQKLKIVQSDGTHTLTQEFDLSGLTLGTKPVNSISPTTATYDLNENGDNHTDKTFTVTPATTGAKISQLIDGDNDPIDSDYDGKILWSLDETELVLTLKTVMLDVFGEAAEAGNSFDITVKLSDNSTISLTIAVEDTTGG